MCISRIKVLWVPLAAALLGACGGGGSTTGSTSSAGSNSSSSDRITAVIEYTVSAEAGQGGQVTPNQQTLLEGEQAQIALLPDPGFRLLSVSGCGGNRQGELYITAPATESCQVTAKFIPSGSLSGQLLPAPSTVIDLSINDKTATLGGNTQCSKAQNIDRRAVVHGFASAAPTGGDSAFEHYADDTNPSDFYRVTLSAGQVAKLEIADHREDENNLALYLWNSDCSQKIAFSDEGGEIEQVTSYSGGDLVVEVRAQSGVSKYILRISNAWDSLSSADDLLSFSAGLPEFVPGELIIEFDPDAGGQAHQDLSQAMERTHSMQLRFRHQQTDRATLASAVSLTALSRQTLRPSSLMRDLKNLSETAYNAINTLRMADFIASQPGVRHVEPNFILRNQLTPNDPRYGNQWHYGKMNLADAWDLTTGERSDGQPVVIAILDTGVYLAHEDLRDKLLPGYDFHDKNSDPDELNGNNSWHGTHVAGTAAAATNNGIGVAGVSWQAKILPVRVLGDNGGSSYNVMQGVRYAAGLSNDSGTVPEHPADVINLSLGGGGFSRTTQELYLKLHQAGTFVVAAAGNANTDTPMYPAAYDGVLSVSATNCHNELSSFSNFGSTISLAAPGGDNNSTSCGPFVSGAILSTVGSGSGSTRSSSYGLLIGTSMAAPHVSGVVALMRAIYPDLTPADFDRLLQENALTDDLGDPGRDDKFGYGLINAAKAVQAAQTLASQNAQWSAQVIAEPGTLNLKQESTAVLELSQEGDGQAPAVLSWHSPADWLSATAIDVDERGLGSYEVHIDRNLFNEGDYGNHFSTLVFALEDESELAVGVHIQVGTATESAPVYVILLDANSRTPVYQTLAQWHNSELLYQLEGIAPGDYLLIAGSDIDVDGFICQPGEICGAYPNFEGHQILSITDQAETDLDFALDILSRTRPLPNPPEAVQRP